VLRCTCKKEKERKRNLAGGGTSSVCITCAAFAGQTRGWKRRSEAFLARTIAAKLGQIRNEHAMYWLSSLPLDSVDPSPEATWIQLQNVTQRNNYSENSEFALPTLKVGTLDSLLSLSDELAKVNAAVESTVNKLRRQLYDVAEEDEDIAEITVEGVRPEAYLQNWKWDEAKFPSKRPPKDTVSAIMDTVQKLDDDLKVKATEFTQLKQQLQALLRKSQGSLAVRDVSMIVPDGLVVSTENMKTMVSVVPRNSVEDWARSYETLTEYVVPRSSVAVEEDADHAVFAFVLFRRVEEEFKREARARGFQVKDIAGTELRSEGGGGEGVDEEEAGIASTRSDSVARIQKLHAELEKKSDLLRRWCLTSYVI
jgi:V-type H+-transporting ATPase subunit C